MRINIKLYILRLQVKIILDKNQINQYLKAFTSIPYPGDKVVRGRGIIKDTYKSFGKYWYNLRTIYWNVKDKLIVEDDNLAEVLIIKVVKEI